MLKICIKGIRKKHVNGEILTSTKNLCLKHKCEKYLIFLSIKRHSLVMQDSIILQQYVKYVKVMECTANVYMWKKKEILHLISLHYLYTD